MQTSCDFCAYNEYDEEDDCYYCSVNMDEDDMARFIQSSYKTCPYYKSGDEYQVVRHQMQAGKQYLAKGGTVASEIIKSL